MPSVAGQVTAQVTAAGYVVLPYEDRIRVRAQKFAKAWEAYHGALPDALTIKLRQPNDNVKINVCKVIVDKGTSFLFGNELHFSLDDNDAEESPEEQWLDKAWAYNQKQAFLNKLSITGSVCGHVFVQIIPQKPYPRLVSIDPALVDVQTRPDDVSIVTKYVIQYKLQLDNNKDANYRKTIRLIEPNTVSPFKESLDYTADDIEFVSQLIDMTTGSTIKPHWEIVEELREEGSKDWTLIQRLPWLYAWPPIADCQNLPMPHTFWGLADLEEDVIHLNRAMNFVLSNTNRIIRYHAHPRPWVKGASPEQLKSAVDETLVLPSTESDVGIIQMEPGGIEPSMNQYKLLKDAIHEVSRIPVISVARVDNIGTLSGIAMQIMYQPLIEKTRLKRTNYGALLNELSRRMLVLANKMPDELDIEPLDSEGAEDHDPTPISISWPEILPKDDLELRQAFSIDANLGLVSTETLSDRLGYDFQTEQDRRHNGEYQLPNVINNIRAVQVDANITGDEVTPGAGPAAKNTPGSSGQGQPATPPATGGSAFGKNDKQKRAGTRGKNQPPASRR